MKHLPFAALDANLDKSPAFQYTSPYETALQNDLQG
jgi:hypothetical protein